VDSIEIVAPGETAARWTLRGVEGDRLYRLTDGKLTLVRQFSRGAR